MYFTLWSCSRLLSLMVSNAPINVIFYKTYSLKSHCHYWWSSAAIIHHSFLANNTLLRMCTMWNWTENQLLVTAAPPYSAQRMVSKLRELGLEDLH